MLLRTLNRLIGKTAGRPGNAAADQQPRAASLSVESLENRVLLSADLTNGVLTLMGTEIVDRITVQAGEIDGQVVSISSPDKVFFTVSQVEGRLLSCRF